MEVAVQAAAIASDAPDAAGDAKQATDEAEEEPPPNITGSNVHRPANIPANSAADAAAQHAAANHVAQLHTAVPDAPPPKRVNGEKQRARVSCLSACVMLTCACMIIATHTD